MRLRQEGKTMPAEVSDVLEEAGTRSFSLTALLPEGFQAVVCGMEGEGQEV
jgi:hypothetical protein